MLHEKVWEVWVKFVGFNMAFDNELHQLTVSLMNVFNELPWDEFVSFSQIVVDDNEKDDMKLQNGFDEGFISEFICILINRLFSYSKKQFDFESSILSAKKLLK